LKYVERQLTLPQISWNIGTSKRLNSSLQNLDLTLTHVPHMIDGKDWVEHLALPAVLLTRCGQQSGT
jgi:hypothetical protein